jgi:hypothetical protein
MISGNVKNPFDIVTNLENLARSQGASVLRIEANFANPRLLELVTKRYGSPVTVLGTDGRYLDVLTIPVR